MEIRKQHPCISAISTLSLPIFYFLVSLFCSSLVLTLGGCAAPGEPSPRRIPVPEAVTDLAAQQSGEEMILTFTLPKATVTHEPLARPPAIEIYRDFRRASAPGTPVAATPQALLLTIPPEMVDGYVEEGHVRFVHPLKPEELEQYSGEDAVFIVRTRASKKQESADSNVAEVRVHAPPEAIGEISAQVTQTAITLSWTPPQKTTSGGALPPLEGYRVYRAEVAPPANPDSANLLHETRPAVLGVTTSPSYDDTQFEFGHTYIYTVRSVAQYGTDRLESEASRPLTVMPKDNFPPAAPQGLVFVIVPVAGEAPAHLELSWAISPDPDLAGYNLYRTEAPGGPPVRLNTALLLTPAFRDISTVPGRRYSYTVTAVDRAGNESPASAPVSAGVPEASVKENDHP